MDKVQETRKTGPARGVMAGLALTTLLGALGISGANIALPDIAADLGASFAGAQWVTIAYLLSVTTLVVGAGQLGDRFGHRRVLGGGIALFSLASVVCAAAPTLPVLVAARAAQGAGAAAMMALTVALARDTAPEGKAGRAIGILGSMSAVGTALGPALGGLLIGAAGWRAVFVVLMAAGVVAMLTVRRFLPATGTARQVPSFDRAGMAVLALTLGAYAMALTLDDARGALRAALLLLAVAGGALFLRVEARAERPMIAPAALRDPVMAAGLAMNAVVAAVMMATLVVGPFVLSRGLGLDPGHVGAVMAVGPVLAALSGLPAGRTVDRFGAARMAVAGIALMAAGSMAFAVLPGIAGVGGYVAAMAILTPGYQLFLAANTTAIMADAGPDWKGTVSGLLNLSRNLGLITGAAAMGALFALAVGTPDIGAARPEAVVQGLAVTFATATACLAGAIVLATTGALRPREA